MELNTYDSDSSSSLPVGIDFVQLTDSYANELSSNGIRNFVSDLILTARYRNLAELRSYVTKHNKEMESVLDKVVILMSEAGHIEVNGDEIFIKNPFLANTSPKNLKKYLSGMFEKAVNKVLFDHENGKQDKSYETAQVFSFPSDEKTMKQLKSAADEYKAKLTDIMKQVSAEKRAGETAAYAGLVTAKITPEVF